MNVPKTDELPAVLISLGSNINPEKNIVRARVLLAGDFPGVKFSSIWESPAVGSSGPNYLNSAALIQTCQSLDTLKARIIRPIENQLGRIRTADKFMDRTIDLDVLIYHHLVVDEELWTQAHLAVPASELWPDFSNSATNKTLRETAKELLGSAEIIQRFDLSD